MRISLSDLFVHITTVNRWNIFLQNGLFLGFFCIETFGIDKLSIKDRFSFILDVQLICWQLNVISLKRRMHNNRSFYKYKKA
ncbi:hypothetical protein VNO78_03643 [Psophocarpus tetragonolobus]|uniref:Uncharacterized protein n=1 Tax=Psophocarpus tetragonolobus TaxID=3891 RepID=A0AAN9T1U8_PSOTE